MHRHHDGPEALSAFRAVFLLLPLVLLAACASTGRQPAIGELVDFSRFHDQPLPAAAVAWLKAGPQSRPSPQIEQIASQIRGATRRERLYRALDVVWNHHFSFDRWYSTQMLARSASDLYREKILGGCSDFALVEAVLFRAVGIPARLALTASVDWMTAYRQNPLALPAGHVFVQVYLEDGWYLVDSTYRLLYSNYDPRNPCYPRREFLCAAGRDYWEMGLHSADDLSRLLQAEAESFQGSRCRQPSYPKQSF